MKYYDEPMVKIICFNFVDVLASSGDGDFYEDIWDRDL